MLTWLRRLLAPVPASSPPSCEETSHGLERRVRALEAERLELLTEWTKTRDQVIRYMKRAGALRARLEATESDDLGELGEDQDQLDLEVLSAKLGAANGRSG